MPTPTGTRSQYAMNGVVPNMTWDDFTSNWGAPSDSKQGQANANISALGPYGVGAYRTANVTGGEGQVGDTDFGTNPWNSYQQQLPDGTTNYFTQGANGGVDSTNQTTNSDSWWDSTGLPLVASLAFGGATAGLSSAGIGASAADATGAGLANVGAGYGAAAGATPLAGSSVNSLADLFGTGASAVGDSSSGVANTVATPASSVAQDASGYFGDAANSVAQNGGSLGANTAADTGAASSVAPSALDTAANNSSLLDTLKDYGGQVSDAWGNLNPLVKTGLTSLGGQGAQDLLGSSNGGDAASAIDNSNYSDSGYSTANGLDYNGGLSGASNTPTLGGQYADFLNNPLGTVGSGLSSLYSGVKGLTGLNGLQLGTSLYDAYNQYNKNNAANTQQQALQNLYAPNSAYAQQMQQTLARKDAAAGRQSQYGPRAVQLAAALTAGQAGILNSSNYTGLNQQTASGNYGGVLNSLFANIAQSQGQDRGAAALTSLLDKYWPTTGGST